MGENVTELETELSVHSGARHAIGCSSGRDAFLLALMGYNLQPGDEVIVPDLTFFATGEVVSFLEGRPVFADVKSDTYNIDPDLIEAKTPRKTAASSRFSSLASSPTTIT
jgi:UDP-2-acetamido-2-deoxy-ribo-hexuluronate aminotransferase